MRPLKIALFSGNFNYVMDGPVRCLNRLVAFLQDDGHEVLVFAPTTDKPACEPAGELISAPSMPLPGRSEYRLALGMSPSIRARLDRFDPDIFHLAAPDWLGHSALKMAMRRGAPAVSSFHTRFDTYARYYGGAWLEAWMTSIMTRFYNRCDQVYVPSQCMIDTLRDQGVSSDLRLWSRGVDRHDFDPARRDMNWRRAQGIADDETVVIFVGRLVLEKGLDKLQEIYDRAEAGGSRLRVLVVGDGPEGERLRARMPNAVFTGYLNGADLGRAYASADIFFNPSVTETFGNVTLEAIASGLPAVCAPATGSKSLIEDGRTGHIAQTGDSDEFYRLLCLLAGDSAGRAAMGRAARTESSRYDWTAVMCGMVRNYYEALDPAAAAGAALHAGAMPGGSAAPDMAGEIARTN